MTKKSMQKIQVRIGEVALYLRGLQFHRTDAGYLLMEYIDYLLLTDKIENPNRDAKNWIQMYNENSLNRVRCKDNIVRYVCEHLGYGEVKPLDTLFGKGNWQACFTE